MAEGSWGGGGGGGGGTSPISSTDFRSIDRKNDPTGAVQGFESLASRLFVQQLVQSNNNETVSIPDLLREESISHQWLPAIHHLDSINSFYNYRLELG